MKSPCLTGEKEVFKRKVGQGTIAASFLAGKQLQSAPSDCGNHFFLQPPLHKDILSIPQRELRNVTGRKMSGQDNRLSYLREIYVITMEFQLGCR